MAFCLIKPLAEKFKQDLKDGTINPDVLYNMKSSAERRKFFERYGGPENAREINTLFESKMILKDFKKGAIDWAKQTAGLKPEVQRDFISKIQKLDHVLSPGEEELFLNDLVNKKVGAEVTYEQAQKIGELADNVEETKKLITPEMPIGSKERLAYGFAYRALKNYIKEIKLQSNKKSILEYVKHPIDSLFKLGGVSKSLLSSLDNSFWGTQGIKMFYSHPTIWVKNFAKSWPDIAKQLIAKSEQSGIKGVFSKLEDPVMTLIEADAVSRPNALNGNYQRMGLDIGIDSEEAFPTAFPERIPLLGRVFSATNVAFNGGAIRMRIDYADKMIKLAESLGVDMKNKEEAIGVGELVNSMTGRGNIGKAEGMAKEINAGFFSIKFLKSNFDTLTMHLLNPRATPFTKKQAALNLIKIIGGIAAILTLHKLLDPENKDELDPRGSKYGSIKVGNDYYDISGKMGSLVSLAVHLVPTTHNGVWGLWSKNSKTGEWSRLDKPKYGQNTALDVFEQFWEGKLSPLAGLVRDAWRGRDFQGHKPTIESSGKKLITPFPIQTFEQLKDSKKGGELAPWLLSEIGVQSTR